MLGVVEDEHVAGGGLGGDDAGILGHEAGTVHLEQQLRGVSRIMMIGYVIHGFQAT